MRNCPAVVQVPHSNVGEVALYPGKEDAHLRAERQKRENEPRRDSGLGDPRERRWRRQCIFLMQKNTFLAT